MSSTPRSGVALIIAISVLAALLFLALPFLYSQSSSLAGARSAAYDGEARRGQATAAGLAAGLAVYAQGLQLSPDYALAQFSTAQLTYSQISQVCTETRHPGFAGSDPARTALRFDQPWTQPNAPSQDLPTVGDGPVTHGATVEDQSWISGRMDPLAMDAVAWAKLFRMAGISDPVTVDAKQWIGNQNIEWQQNSDGFGRLAYGLEQQIRIGGQQIRRLDQLTSILPQHLPLTLPPPVHTPPWQNPPDSQRDAAEVDPLVKADPANRSFRTTPLSLAEVERLRPYLAGMDATSHTPAQARAGIIDLGNVVLRSGAQYLLDANQPRTLVPGDRILGANGSRGWVTRGTANGLQVTVTGTPYAAADALGVMAIPAVNINALPASQPMVRWFQDFWDQTNGFQPGVATSFGWPTDPLANPIQTLADLPRLYLLDPRAGDGNPDPDKQYLRPPVAVTNWGIVAVDSAATARDAQGRIQAQRRQRTVVQAVPQERPIEARWHTQAEFESLVRQRHGSWVVAGPHPTNRIAQWGQNLAERLALGDEGWLEAEQLGSFARNPAVTFDWRCTFGLDGTTYSKLIYAPVAGAGVIGNAQPASVAQQLKADGVHGGFFFAMNDALFGAATGAELPPRHISMRFKLGKIDANAECALINARAAAPDTSHWSLYYDTTQRALVLSSDNGSAHPVQFWYRADLEAGRWYHLQVYESADLPGYRGIILDGVVGRDAIAAQSFARMGDHYTWPSFRLASPTIQTGDDPTTLELQLPPGPRPFAMPTEGYVRIDDEYFRYEDQVVAGQVMTLSQVQRGYRVATKADATTLSGTPPVSVPDNALRIPVAQAHQHGVLVTPGWTQVPIAQGGGTWLRGKARLLQDLSKTMLDEVHVFTVAPMTWDIPAAWPRQGQMRFDNGFEVWYSLQAGSATTVDLHWPAGVETSWTQATRAWVTTMRVDVETPGFATSGWVQLSLGTSQTEWLRYDNLLTLAAGDPCAGTYFVVNAGWDDDTADPPTQRVRGAQGTSIQNWLAADAAQIVPVQTGLALGAPTEETSYPGTHRLESGDTAWIICDDGRSFATRVRHAAHDVMENGDWRNAADGMIAWEDPLSDVSVLPDPFQMAQTIVVGAGWNGQDLSAVATATNARRARGPRHAAFANVYIGQAAPGSTLSSPSDIVVDDLCAGPMQWNGRLPGLQQASVQEIGATGDGLLMGDDLPAAITASQPVFGQSYGLVAIDGEVFAYRQNIGDPTRAQLIARALLGSAARDLLLGPTGPEVGGVPINPALPVVVLPMGPVGELCSELKDGVAGSDVVTGTSSDFYRDTLLASATWPAGYKPPYAAAIDAAPMTVVCDPLNGEVEAMRLLSRLDDGGRQRLTVTWLRGLYSSVSRDWIPAYDPAADWRTPVPADLTWENWPGNAGNAAAQAAGKLNPVVIGWWPRFAPAMPAAPSAQHLRSRSHAWAGFALRLHGSRFDPTIAALAAGGVAEVDLADSAGCTVTARALAAGEQAGELFDWDKSPEQVLGVGLVVMPQKPFQGWQTATERFVGREVDGAELRLYWQMPVVGTGLEAIANAQGRAPRIGTVRLRCVAPTRILSVEEVR